MNSLPPCGCSFPSYCDACMTSKCPESSERKLKAEPQNRNQPVCSTNNCVIFGSHDVNPFPEYPCPAKHIKAKNENRNSLGSPIGLVASNVNFKTEGKPTDIIQARYATYLKAFARLHLNPETTWTSTLIDDIMKEGLVLYSTSEKKENKLESPSNIYTASEKNILREFEMSGCNFQVELMQKFILNSADSEEMGAKGDTNDNLILEDLKPTLKKFFDQHKYCLLTVRSSFYIMIWRSQDVYFIFDVCGRRVSDFRTDQDEGVAMLICLKTLENVRHLIASLSSLRLADPIRIREIKIVKVTTPSGGVIQQDYGTRTHQYQVINDDYAYLKAGLHLTLNKADLLRNRSALPVGVAAMVVSKIDHPATWNTKIIDKILCFGVNFCQSCWLKCVINDYIDVTEFPCRFNMGQFRISIELIARKYEGIWRCVPRYKYSELAQAIEKAFDVGDQKLLVQVNCQIYAIWKKHDFIYLFDPYRHRILGKEDESDVYGQMEKSATVRMFRSFEVFMNTFNHILLDSNRTSQFLIHVLKIINIQQKTAPEEEAKLDTDGEVISINDHICFEEAEDLCQKALGDISDYEDEDLKSDVDEMELKTSSSEAEDLMEEEEAFGGAVEELEGLESPSSGEEDAGHKNIGTASKGSKVGKANKGRKMGKSGKSREGKGDKGNKGKGAKDDEGGKKRKKDNDEYDSSDKEDKKKKKKNQDDTGKSQKENQYKNKAKDDKVNDKKKGKDNRSKEEEHDYEKNKDKGKNNDKYNKAKEQDGKDKSEDERSKDERSKDERSKDERSKDERSKDERSKDERSKDDKSKAENKKESNEIKDKETKYLKKDENATKKYVTKNEDKDNNKDLNKDLNKESDKDRNYMDKVGNKDKGQTENGKKAEIEKSGKDNDEDVILDKDRGPNKYSGKDIEKDKEAGNEKDTDKIKDKDKDLRKETDKDNDSEKNKEKDHEMAKDNEYNKDKDKYYGKDNIKGKTTKNEKAKDVKSLKDNTTLDSIGKEDKGIKDKDIRIQSRLKVPYDGAEADDENEDNFFKNAKRYCSGPNPNNYPGYFKCPMDMAVIGSESGSYASICKLFQAGFKIADRILTMTPWGNFVVFRCLGKISPEEKYYFIFDGCTCNINRFRHLDLSIGTAGLLCFEHMHNVIEYIRQVRKLRNKEKQQLLRQETAEKICSQYCF